MPTAKPSSPERERQHSIATWSRRATTARTRSTFVARIVASTRAGLTSASVAAMSALKGPLHGGAPGPSSLDMLDDIGSAEHAANWLEGALSRGDRLMGFGHRVYRVRDPRADALKEAVRRLTTSNQVNPSRLRLAEGVRRSGGVGPLSPQEA